MVQITSTTGIVSGIDYNTLINNLIKADSAQSDAITVQNTTLTNQQTAIASIMANLTALKGTTDALGKSTLYNSTTATSSNNNVISVTTTGTPTSGTYQYTALSKAQSQQVISSGYESTTTALGTGTLSFRFGNGVDTSMSLGNINGGAGFTSGKIKITDRSGTSAIIDLSGAKTIDDVLNAINDNGAVGVTASVAGDRIVLTDNTGETTANLKVQEVSSGKTAASLGLSGINTASNSATGSDIVYLSNNLNLSALNDGIGVETNNSAADIKYTLGNGDTGEIKLSGSKTLGDVITKINAANTNLKATIASDGSGLVLTDSSGGTTNTFTVSDENGSKALEDLGLNGTAAGGVIAGSRILSGAKTVLLSDLNGGNGLGALGKITITDRAGNSTNVDLSNAETLEEVINKINDAASAAPIKVNIAAQVNDAGNGIELVDSSGATSGNLKVDNYDDGTTTATKIFGSAVDVADNSVNSGDLHLQVIGLNTQLGDLNGGDGVTQGKFSITDSAGKTGTINIDSSVKTIGDVVQAINLSTAHVLAEINDTGDGIVIQDAAGGAGTLTVAENGSTTAADLNLLGTATTQNSTQVIDGAMTRTIDISDTDSLGTLTDKINKLGAGVTASMVSDGSDTPYRLSIVSNQTGKAGKFILDTSKADMSFDQISQAQDALLSVGSTSSSNKSMLVSSNTNSFTNVLSGATLTIQNVSDTPVTVSVSTDTTSLAAQIKAFVNTYNTFRKTLNTDTAYDTSTNTGAVLNGDYSITQVETDLSKLLSNFFPSGNTVNSMAQLGISFNTDTNDGTLKLDENTLDSVLSTNLADVKSLFTTANTGVSAQFSNMIGNLGVDVYPTDPKSLLGLHNQALQTTIDNNQKTIASWTTRLDAERTRLTNQFANLEVTLAKIQSNYSALSSIDWMLDSSSTSSSSSLFGNSSSSSSSSSSL
jgi:flagellar hook-associated protein 2